MQQKSKEEILKGKGIYQGFSSTYTWDGILAAMEEYGEEKSNEANEFIGDIAKLLGEDGLGFDDLTWTIDDFKNAINEYRSQPPPQHKSKEEIINILLNNEHGSLENDGTVSKAGMILRNQYPDIADKITSQYRSQPTSEEYKLETGDGYGTTYGASQPPASGGYSPEQYWVKFTEMGDDYPNEKVVEMVSMPSGDIVVRVESGESLWFDKDGNHPKSKLIKIPKQNN